jgi:transposase
MRDTQLYAQILGVLPPWKVTQVELDNDDQDVAVHLKHGKPSALTCPECGKKAPYYDARERRWRHLDTCQYQTILVANVPRVRCEEHGVKQIRVPWAEEKSRFTALFEALVIDWLKEASISAVARRMRMSWDEVDGVMQRAVRRGLAKRELALPDAIGVDETSFQKRHEYVTVVTDYFDGAVLHVTDGKGADSLASYYEQFTKEELGELELVAMDMSKSYISATKSHVPDAEAKIAFDKYHIAAQLGDAVNKVRRKANEALLEVGDDRLKGTKHDWLQSPEKMSWHRRRCFKELRDSALKTARAWALKETAMGLWHYNSRGWAAKGWDRWYQWAIRSRLEPMKKMARMVKRHLYGILTAVVEGVNKRYG